MRADNRIESKGETMKKCFGTVFILGVCLLMAEAAGQTIESVNGVRVVHNVKGGTWGADPKISLELIRTIGGPDEKDENLAFGSPYDLVRDSAGNLYCLDVRNCQIQKLGADGKYLKTIGRRGQGPGEFQSPFSMDIDEDSNLFVADMMGRKIEVFNSDGKPMNTMRFESFAREFRRLKSRQFVRGGALMLRDLMAGGRKLPMLLTVVDRDDRVKKTFGEATDYKNVNVNSTANSFSFDKDAEENIVLGFWYQNRVEKYSADGTLIWRADRPLNFGTDVIDPGSFESDEKGSSRTAPQMNMVSIGIAADPVGRVWVNAYNRQMSREEQGGSILVGGQIRSRTEPKIQKMDIYKLEVYGPDGVLLGEIPLNHLAHGIRIFGDMLFIWERNNAVYYQYRIIEKL
jgi:hypothetical protein